MDTWRSPFAFSEFDKIFLSPAQKGERFHPIINPVWPIYLIPRLSPVAIEFAHSS